MFEQFLLRNPHLMCVNASELCEGLITRVRKTKRREEKAVLDFFIICEKVRPFLAKMVIDEQRVHILTNFNPIRRGGKAIESDHNTTVLELMCSFDRKKPERRELFNFKNKDCQESFLALTSSTTKLTECFLNDQPFNQQAQKWNKSLNDIFHQTFRKIRNCSKSSNGRKKGPKNEIDWMRC